MLSRVRAWLAPEQPSAPVPAADTHDDTKLDELSARVQTVARSQSKLSLRLDDIAEQIASNHQELLARLDTPPPSHDGLLDAIDRLDDAARSVGPDQDGLGEGLRAIAARLERVLADGGTLRHAQTGVPPDGQRVRVIGTERHDQLPAGVVTRVVRSAATRNGELLREGEVLVNKPGT